MLKTDIARNALHGSMMKELEYIDNPNYNIVVIHRPITSKIHALMNAFQEKKIKFNIDQVVDVDKCTEPVKSILDTNGMAADFWLQDIEVLCKNLAGLERTNQIRLKLQTITEDECRLFHVDYKCLRLICTYFGPGTQWVANHAVDRDQLGTPWKTFDELNLRIVKDLSQIKFVPTGAVALLKGENYPGNSGNGVVHRSTPIEKLNMTRIRLCVDSAHEHEEK